MTNDTKLFEPRYRIIFSLARLGGKGTYSEIMSGTGGMSNSTFYMNMKQLMLEGIVERENDTYVLTSKGWKIVKSATSQLAELINAIVTG